MVGMAVGRSDRRGDRQRVVRFVPQAARGFRGNIEPGSHRRREAAGSNANAQMPDLELVVTQSARSATIFLLYLTGTVLTTAIRTIPIRKSPSTFTTRKATRSVQRSTTSITSKPAAPGNSKPWLWNRSTPLHHMNWLKSPDFKKTKKRKALAFRFRL